MAQTPKGKHVSNPQQHALFGNSHSGIFQAQTSLETLKDRQRDFGPGIFHCVSSKTEHAVTSFFIENPSFFSAGVFDEKAGCLDKKTRVFDEKGVELLMKNARVFDKKKARGFDENSCGC